MGNWICCPQGADYHHKTKDEIARIGINDAQMMSELMALDPNITRDSAGILMRMFNPWNKIPTVNGIGALQNTVRNGRPTILILAVEIKDHLNDLPKGDIHDPHFQEAMCRLFVSSSRYTKTLKMNKSHTAAVSRDERHLYKRYMKEGQWKKDESVLQYAMRLNTVDVVVIHKETFPEVLQCFADKQAHPMLYAANRQDEIVYINAQG